MDDEKVVIELNKNPNAPLAMLFGWAGCKDRYLSKYSAMYQNAGFSVVRYTVDFSKIRWFLSYKKYAFIIYQKVLRNNNFPSILMHAFSMNGGSVVAGLWQLFDIVDDGKSIKEKVTGIIFDSAPAYTGFLQLGTAASLAFLPPAKYGSTVHWLSRILLTIYFIIYNGFIWLQSLYVPNIWKQYYAYFYLCDANDLPKKQLVIYSYSDIICLPNSIEYYIAKQKSHDVDFKCVVFSDSLHCDHLRVHEKEYVDACLKFALMCLHYRN